MEALDALQEITKKYETQMIKATLANSKLRELTDELGSSLEAFKNLFDSGHKCSICQRSKISHIVHPCRHCFCQSCGNKTLRTRCHICRGACSSMERIYLG